MDEREMDQRLDKKKRGSHEEASQPRLRGKNQAQSGAQYQYEPKNHRNFIGMRVAPADEYGTGEDADPLEP